MVAEDEYYEGMFGSLKHNIFLMLNQMEGNSKNTKINMIPYLDLIRLRIEDIKRNYSSSTFKEKEKELAKRVNKFINRIGKLKE